MTRQPLARLLLNEPVVLYRREDGAAVALEDRCCHRHLPLSMGRLEGDELRCGYHGLRFAPDGRCTEIPGQASVPPQARVRAYPLIERYQWLWIWMGAPERADAALIPNWWWADHREWAYTQPEQIYVKCNYQLIADNVLDVTHLAYVHSSSIGASSITEFPATVEREERLVRLTRWIRDRAPPPLYKRAGGFPDNVDRWQIVEHVPPSYSVNFAGCQDATRRIDLMALSAPTPETERSTHYFYGFVRNFGRCGDGSDLRRRHGARVPRGHPSSRGAAAHARAEAGRAERGPQGRCRAARRATHAAGDARARLTTRTA